MKKRTRAAVKFTKTERRQALKAVAAIERHFGLPLGRWALRKHLTIVLAKQRVAREVGSMRSQIRKLLHSV